MKMTFIALTAVGLMMSSTALAGSHTGGAELADDQTFTYRLLDQFPTLDPQLIEETAGNHVARQIFEGLTTQDAQGNLTPGVAESWEASEGNTVWTFKLRDDAVWSNGDPVTAQDFVYGWKRAADPATASPYAWYVEITQVENAAAIVAGEAEPDSLGVEAVDDTTFRVTLENPLPYFPNMTVFATLYPAHQATIEEFGSDWTKPENIVSNGAYTLEELVLNETFTLEKNPDYWDADNVVIEEIKGFIVNDTDQALTRWEAGEFDMNDELPAGQFPALQEQFPDEAFSVPRLCSYYYAVNFTDSGNPALQDERVREALSYAIDRDVIVDQVLKGGQSPAYSFAHVATAGFEAPEIEYGTLSQAERDAKATELLDAAKADGVDMSQPLKLIYNTSESHKQIATIVSQMWKQKLGVETTLENMEWQTYLDVRGNQNFDVARSAWCADYNEASTFVDLLGTTHGANDGKYSNERVDELLAQSKTAEDPQPLYTEIEEIVADEMGIIPIYHYANTFLMDSSMKGFPLENAENNWYVKDFFRVVEN